MHQILNRTEIVIIRILLDNSVTILLEATKTKNLNNKVSQNKILTLHKSKN